MKKVIIVVLMSLAFIFAGVQTDALASRNDDREDRRPTPRPTRTPSPTPTPTVRPTNRPNDHHDNRHDHDRDDRHDNDNDDCEETSTPRPTQTPVPSSSPTTLPTQTPIASQSPVATQTPIATPDPDVCPNLDGIQTSLPDEYHFDNAGVNCLKFELGGPSQPAAHGGPSQPTGIGGANVLGATTVSTGQVLGVSTMAGTGAVEDSIFYSLFSIGSLLTSVGIMRNGKKK